MNISKHIKRSVLDIRTAINGFLIFLKSDLSSIVRINKKSDRHIIKKIILLNYKFFMKKLCINYLLTSYHLQIIFIF